jgi:hypothetical protein
LENIFIAFYCAALSIGVTTNRDLFLVPILFHRPFVPVNITGTKPRRSFLRWPFAKTRTAVRHRDERVRHPKKLIDATTCRAFVRRRPCFTTVFEHAQNRRFVPAGMVGHRLIVLNGSARPISV